MTVIKCIFADRRAIPPLIIIPSVLIIESWFYKKITRNKLVTVSVSGYTNKGICLTWLHYFIKHNNYGLDKE